MIKISGKLPAQYLGQHVAPCNFQLLAAMNEAFLVEQVDKPPQFRSIINTTHIGIFFFYKDRFFLTINFSLNLTASCC
jgi:hypothetical protein